MEQLQTTKKFFSWPLIIVGFLSTAAISMVLLTLLLLPQTSEIVGIAQWRLVNADSFIIETDIDYRGTVSRVGRTGILEEERQSFDLKTVGTINMSEFEYVQQQHLFDLKVGEKEDGTSQYIFGGEIIKMTDPIFLFLNSVPKDFGTFRLDRFAGRWLKVNLNEILSRINLPIIGTGRSITNEDKEYLTEQFKLTPFLSVLRKINNETINGIDTYHYEVLPEVLFFKDYFINAETIRRGAEFNTEERKEIDKFFSNLTAKKGEVWIGRGDYYPYRIYLRFNYNDGKKEGIFSIALTFSDFNKNIEIKSPENQVEDVDAIIESLLPNLVNHLPLANYGGQNVINGETTDNNGLPMDNITWGADLDPDGDGLTNAMEFFYGSDPNNWDTDGDGISDGDEVKMGQNPTGSGRLFDFGISNMNPNQSDDKEFFNEQEVDVETETDNNNSDNNDMENEVLDELTP